MDATQARTFYEECLNTLYLRRDLERMADFYAPGVTAHPSPPGLPPGIEGLKLMTQGWLMAFSDTRIRIESFTQEGDCISCQLVMTGTHTGPFLGVPATGRSVELVDRPRYRLENGRIVEFWHSPDIQTLMSQLGVPAAA